jgi:hypothetical protein
MHADGGGQRPQWLTVPGRFAKVGRFALIDETSVAGKHHGISQRLFP